MLPKQVFTFLGQVFDLSKGVCYPTEARFLSIQEAIHPLLFSPLTTPRQVMHLLGLLASTEKLVPQDRLHVRHLQFHLRRNFNCHLKDSLDSPFSLDPSVKVHLRWWLLRNNVMAQAPLHPPKYVTSIYTDASAQGWGAHCAHMIAQGHWSTQQSKLHINVLELKAVLLALKTFVPQLSLHQRIIQVASDNTTVCVYINKLGGTCSWDMFALTWHLLAFCRKNKVVLSARHVPGLLPSYSSLSTCGQKVNQLSELQDASCGSSLGNQRVASRSIGTVNKKTSHSSSKRNSLKATSSRGVSSKSRESKSSCLLAEVSLEKKGFSLVLQALTKAPFEPLSLAEPKFLTWKTVFLLPLLLEGEGVRFMPLLLRFVLTLKDGQRSSLKQILLFWLRTSWLQKMLQFFLKSKFLL